MTRTQNDPHRSAGRKVASLAGRFTPIHAGNEMIPDSYHIDIHMQGEPKLVLPLRKRAECKPAIIPPAVKHVQRITGAPLSTARLLAELAGFAISNGEAT